MAMFYLVSPLLDCERGALLSFVCTPFNTTPHTPGHFTEAFHRQRLTFTLKFKNVAHTPHYNDHCHPSIQASMRYDALLLPGNHAY
jgi:hypothetical protein